MSLFLITYKSPQSEKEKRNKYFVLYIKILFSGKPLAPFLHLMLYISSCGHLFGILSKTVLILQRCMYMASCLIKKNTWTSTDFPPISGIYRRFFQKCQWKNIRAKIVFIMVKCTLVMTCRLKILLNEVKHCKIKCLFTGRKHQHTSSSFWKIIGLSGRDQVWAWTEINDFVHFSPRSLVVKNARSAPVV